MSTFLMVVSSFESTPLAVMAVLIIVVLAIVALAMIVYLRGIRWKGADGSEVEIPAPRSGGPLELAEHATLSMKSDGKRRPRKRQASSL